MKRDGREERKKAEERLVREIEEDFEARREERRRTERKWELNIGFIAGRQYCGLNAAGEIEDEDNPVLVFYQLPKKGENEIVPLN